MEDLEIVVEIKVKVTGEDIDDIMCSALEGGINYWCCKAEVVGEYLGEYGSEQVSRGGMLILHDSESDDKWELNKEKFLKGLQRYISIDSSFISDGSIDACSIDADVADSIVQYALFDELVFG